MERKWWTLIVVCVAVFMLLLDITVVNVALPSIQRDLDASFTDLQWVVDAYALTLAALVLTAGSLADRLGRRSLFATGLVLFSLASLLCGLAPSPNFLNAMRALQGVGGAVMFAVSLALVAQEFPPGRQRGTALGLYGATIGMAVAIGPLVGGALTDAFGWEWIFFLNVPIGIAALFATFTYLRESRDPRATRPDWPGVVLFSGSLFAFVFALVRGNDEGWGSALIVGLLVAAAVMLLAFCLVERRVAEPMLPLGLFKRPAFTGVQIAAFAVAGSMFSMFLYLTLYMQNYLELTPLQSGVRFLPSTIASFLFAMLAGQLVSRLPARFLLAVGLTGVGGGLLLMSGIHDGDDWTGLLGGLVLTGACLGLLNPVISSVAVGVVPREQSGMASGINQTFRQVGIAVGIAAWGALFLGRGADKVSQLAAHTPAASGDRPRQIVEAASSGALQPVLRNVPANARDAVVNAAHQGFLAGLNEILVAAAVLAFVGAILSLLLVRTEDAGHQPAQSGERTPEPAAA